MAIYLVMKNNLKRTFATRYTYVVMILIPVVISFLGTISNSFTGSSIRVGVISNAKEFGEVEGVLSVHSRIECEMADKDSKHTDLITGKYQYLIDVTGKGMDAASPDIKERISTIIAEAKQKNESEVDGLSQTERILALLLTAYMMIATIYATTMIRDKKNQTIERFCIAGFTKNAYGHGYMASTALIILCQLSLAVFILAVFNRSFDVTLVSAVKTILFMTVVASVFGVSVASLLKSELNANISASSIVIILSLLGGTFVSIDQMPELLQRISVISPIRWLQLLPL